MVLIRNSEVDVVKSVGFEDMLIAIKQSRFPPHWKVFGEIHKFDDNIGMICLGSSHFLAFRSIVLQDPVKHEFEYKNYGKTKKDEGVLILVGDEAGNDTHLFVKCDMDDEEDKEFVAEFKEDAELIVIGAKSIVQGMCLFN